MISFHFHPSSNYMIDYDYIPGKCVHRKIKDEKTNPLGQEARCNDIRPIV